MSNSIFDDRDVLEIFRIAVCRIGAVVFVSSMTKPCRCHSIARAIITKLRASPITPSIRAPAATSNRQDVVVVFLGFRITIVCDPTTDRESFGNDVTKTAVEHGLELGVTARDGVPTTNRSMAS